MTDRSCRKISSLLFFSFCDSSLHYFSECSFNFLDFFFLLILSKIGEGCFSLCKTCKNRARLLHATFQSVIFLNFQAVVLRSLKINLKITFLLNVSCSVLFFGVLSSQVFSRIP